MSFGYENGEIEVTNGLLKFENLWNNEVIWKDYDPFTDQFNRVKDRAP